MLSREKSPRPDVCQGWGISRGSLRSINWLNVEVFYLDDDATSTCLLPLETGQDLALRKQLEQLSDEFGTVDNESEPSFLDQFDLGSVTSIENQHDKGIDFS